MDNALVETLRASTEALEEAGVTYAITGSIASSRHGEPVSSLDVDLIVSATQEQTVVVARKLSPRFYAPEEMLQEAAQDQGFANLIDNQTSFKVDLSFVEATGFLGEVSASSWRWRSRAWHVAIMIGTICWMSAGSRAR